MNLLKSVANISFFTLISRITGFIRDIIIAAKLGTGPSSDILFIALKIPNFFRRIFAEGAFSQAFIPLFSELLVSKNDQQALAFARHIFYYFLCALIIFVLGFELFTPQIMYIFAPGFTQIPEQYAALISLARITFPYIALISIVTLINGVLNSYKIFIPGSIMPIIYNIGLICAIFTLTNLTGDVTKALAWGLILAGIIQLLIMLAILRSKKIKLFPQKNQQQSAQFKKFTKIIIPAIFAAGIIQLNSWIDTIIATLIPNAVSYIYYSERIVQLPLAIIGISLSVAILPDLSKKIKKQDVKASHKLFTDSINLGLFFALPAALGLFFLADEIIATLFARGAFDQNSTLASAAMLKIYAFAVPAYILNKIMLTNFYAHQDTKTPVKIAAIILLINLILNLILIQIFSYLGIAIATLIASWCNILLLYLLLNKKSYFKATEHFPFKTLGKILFNNLIFAALLYVTSLMFSDFLTYPNIKQIILLCLIISSALICYLISNFISKTYSFSELKNLLK